MPKKSIYIYQQPGWPGFYRDQAGLSELLARVRHQQGKLLGRMEGLGFTLQAEASLKTLTLDVLKTSEIEGEILDAAQVRSSLARKLGMDIAGLISADRYVEGVVEMMLDATQNYAAPLTGERLFDWHAALFPTGRSGMHRIVVGAWRDNKKEDPMQVVSGAMGKEKVHFQAPGADVLENEMKQFCDWFNKENSMDPVVKAAIAHIWFITIHPFDDGNGRIARALTDMLLARADGTPQRFYSLSAQIRKERSDYYTILEKTQKGGLDVTAWVTWFLICLDASLTNTDESLGRVLHKAKFWKTCAATGLTERQKFMVNKLLDGFDGKLNTSKWAKMTKVSQDTALRDIQDLIEKNILVKESAGGRNTNYTVAG